MDKEREIRLLIPPIFFFASLYLGIAANPGKSVAEVIPAFPASADNIWPNAVVGIIEVLAGGSLLLLTAGYSIGGITILLLRLIYRIFLKNKYKGTYEAALPKDALPRVMELIYYKKDTKMTTDNEAFFAGVTLDHDILPERSERLHKWMVRRWSTFNVSANSSVSLFLSLAAGGCYGLFTYEWYLWMVVLSLIFSLSSIHAWRGCMGMRRFQAERMSINKPPCEDCPGNGLRLYIDNRT
ncbi:MAG: hypothetical protein HY804_06470 [Nitrospinae bacterium]|nr:hypothetical protein [Nitrospinota bacterium]